MNYNNHSKLEGQHAFLGASKYHWINYDVDRLCDSYARSFVPIIGTLIHELANDLIKNKIKLGKSDKKMVLLHLLKNKIPKEVIDVEVIYDNLMNYVNDAIGYRMVSEQILYVSDNVFGTADAISQLDNVIKKRFLRIHDLKTGITPAHIEQLEIYAAFFCLEYNIKPGEIDMELRIYQNGEVLCHKPETDEILPIMDKIISFDKIINRMKGVNYVSNKTTHR